MSYNSSYFAYRACNLDRALWELLIPQEPQVPKMKKPTQDLLCGYLVIPPLQVHTQAWSEGQGWPVLAASI